MGSLGHPCKFQRVSCLGSATAQHCNSGRQPNFAALNRGCVFCFRLDYLPAALRAAQICRYLVYSEADFEVFRPAGATRCTDGGEIWHGEGEGPLLRAKFHPHRCNDKGVGPPKLKFLLRFDQNVEYKRPTGAFPLSDFHKICRVCTAFQDALGVKIWLDLLKGYLTLPMGWEHSSQR